jgi:glycosyltransferase involved in cell wall biosynthesis
MIWHLIDSRTVGGAERHIALLVRALNARNIPAQAVLYNDYGGGPWLEQLRAEGIPVRVLDGSFSGLLNAVRHDRPALLHLHGYKAGIFGRLAALRWRIPVVTTFHTGDRSSGRLAWYERLDEWTAVFGERIAVTETVQRRLPYRSTVVGSFSPLPPDPKPALPRRAAFVGRLSPEKRPEFFCRLAAVCGGDIEWHIYGDGPLANELKRLYSNKIHFHGVVTDMSQVWPTLGLLVMPSLFEGLPLAGLEALAGGVPILASRVGGLPQLVTDDVTGWLFERDDLEEAVALVRKWNALTESEQARMRSACRDHVRKHFSEQQQIDKLLGIYRRAGYPMSTQPGFAFSVG